VDWGERRLHEESDLRLVCLLLYFLTHHRVWCNDSHNLVLTLRPLSSRLKISRGYSSLISLNVLGTKSHVIGRCLFSNSLRAGHAHLLQKIFKPSFSGTSDLLLTSRIGRCLFSNSLRAGHARICFKKSSNHPFLAHLTFSSPLESA